MRIDSAFSFSPSNRNPSLFNNLVYYSELWHQFCPISSVPGIKGFGEIAMVNDNNGVQKSTIAQLKSREVKPKSAGLPLVYCNRLQRQVEVIAQEIELIREPSKFEHAAIVITHILQSIGTITAEFQLNQLNQYRLLMTVMANEWLATLHLPNDEELSAFHKHLGNMSLLIKALTAQVEIEHRPLGQSSSGIADKTSQGKQSTPENRTTGDVPQVSDTGRKNKVIGHINPDERLSQYRLMVSTSQDMLAMIDSEYRYIIANPTYAQTFGNQNENIIGLTVPEVMGEKNFLERVKPLIDKALSGESIRFENSIELANQQPLYLEVCYQPYTNLKGNVTGMVVSARNITARKQILNKLENSEQRFRTLCDLSPTGIFQNDIDGSAVYVNRKTAEYVGISQEDCLQTGWAESLHPDDREKIFHRWNQAVLARSDFNEEYRFLHEDGREVWVSCAAVPEFDRQENCIGYIGTLVDITEQKLSEQKNRLVASVFKNTQDGILITDSDANIISVNPAFEKITGYIKAEIIGKNPRILRSEQQDCDFYEMMWQQIIEQGFWRGELWNRKKDGSTFPQWMSISAIRDEQGQVCNYVSVFSDISAIKQTEQKLSWLAYHDPLTQLANRSLFTERLEHSLARAAREGSILAVLFVDLDKFKHINDSFGHKSGDELLVEVANRLQRVLRVNDVLARFGGDEFTIMIESFRSLTELYRVAEKILNEFQTPFKADGHQLYVSISMGISVYPQDGKDAESLIKNADSAMYHSKRQGGDCFSFYTAELTEQARQRIRIESGIRQALVNNELKLVYQPQFDSENGNLVGAEALLRWHSEQLGDVSPGYFIPIVEESSIIHELGIWILQQACQQAVLWKNHYGNSFRMAVNISARQLQKSNFVDELKEVLKRTQLSPDNLELEVTEGVIMGQVERQQLMQLRKLGLGISIDDFGVGYSSLAYLSQLPVDRLKIDQSFVQDIGNNQRHEAIVRAVIAMGHAHGLTIVAEGVEKNEQQNFLKREGCDEIQGFLMGKPMSVENFQDKIA